MRGSRIGILLVTLSAGTSWAADYPSYDISSVDATIDPDAFTLVWADEFDTLRASVPNRGTGPWFTGVHAVLASGEKMAHVPDPAYSIVAGVLNMQTRLDPVDSKRVEAHLQTNDGNVSTVTFETGYLEARIWVAAAKGSHGGLWLLTEEHGEGHAEVDVVETYGVGDATVHFSTHIWPIAPQVHQWNSKIVRKDDVYAGFHLYGVQATDTEFIFYYDRKEMARIQRLPEQRKPFYVLLSLFGNPTQPVIEPATMQVDYVRIYAPKRVPKPPFIFPPP